MTIFLFSVHYSSEYLFRSLAFRTEILSGTPCLVGTLDIL